MVCGRGGDFRGTGPETEQVTETEAERSAQAKLNEVAPGYPSAIFALTCHNPIFLFRPNQGRFSIYSVVSRSND